MIDFQQVSEQVKRWGESAKQRDLTWLGALEKARQVLTAQSEVLTAVQAKIDNAARQDSWLRCARPLTETLTAHFPPAAMPAELILLAADGSQINPDRHEAIQYSLINVGLIEMDAQSPGAPTTHIFSDLLYGDDLSSLSETKLALKRDLAERQRLAERAQAVNQAGALIVACTDGPLELWGGKDRESAADFQSSLKDYLASLRQLQQLGVINAGYVDKPWADLVVRMLEVLTIPDAELGDLRAKHPFAGVTDADLFHDLLAPGERSSVFSIQSRSLEKYTGALALHFFYLNVGREGLPALARVEIPAWVGEAPDALSTLHAVLIQQCRILGGTPYPYLLHRAHEAALVSLAEKDQVTQMIAQELRQRGLPVGIMSYKQMLKNAAGRSRHRRF